MEMTRTIINEGLSQRAAAGVKVRQPLASITVDVSFDGVNSNEILKEELNVKEVKLGKEVSLDLNITPELHREGLMREVVRQVQSIRKEAGLNVEDRIKLELFSKDAELMQAIAEFTETIQMETLAESLTTDANRAVEGFSKDVKVETAELAVALQRI
jgi:isoleucyl-tRNA synthetase